MTAAVEYETFWFEGRQLRRELQGHEAQFAVLQRKHRDMRVRWSIGKDRWGYQGWVFYSFDREGGHRNPNGKGNGAIALREVCQLADSMGISELHLWTDGEKRIAYYESFGFTVTSVRDGVSSMTRKRPS